MTVKIDREAGKAPRVLVDALVLGQAYPFLVALEHKSKKPLVVPSSGINTPIASGGEPVTVKVKSYDQAWHLVSDLSALASLAGNEEKDFATLIPAPAVPVEAPAAPLVEGEAPAAEEVPVVVDPKALKAGKAATTAEVK